MIVENVIELLRPYWFSGKGRLLKALGPSSGRVHSRIFGFDMELELQDSIQRQVYLGIFEPWETRFVTQYLQPGMTFLDVGANIGYFTALAASRVGARECPCSSSRVRPPVQPGIAPAAT